MLSKKYVSPEIKKMKIAFIIDLWDPITGGSQTHVQELVNRLIENHGCEIDIFTRSLIYDSSVYDHNEDFFDGHLRIIRVGPATGLSNTWGRIATLWTVAWKITIENRKKKYDLIHAHSILGGAMGRLASYLTKKPLLLTVHGSPNLDGGRKNFDYYAENFILTKLKYNKIISVGKSYLSHKNVNREIDVIPNGVALKKFDAISDVKKADAFKILFVGRLDWVKGIDSLMEACNILKKKNDFPLMERKLEVHLVGYGFDAEKYRGIVRNAGLDGMIIFKGKITGKTLIKEYKSSHLFILPSLCEGQPLTILEAMAAGLPVLTTYAADNSEIVSSDTGWKVSAGNPDQLAEKIKEIMTLPEEKLEKMGQKAHKIVSLNHRWEDIAKAVFKIYQTLTGKSRD